MAVAFNSAGGAVDVSNVTSLSTSVTNTAGTYMIAWVGVAAGASSNHAMTYNGVAMTLLATQAAAAPNIAIFGLASPATGANTLAASWTTADHAAIGCMTFTGVGSVGSVDKANVAAGTTSVTTSGTLGTGDMLAGGFYYVDGTDRTAVTTGTQRFEDGTGTTTGETLNLATNTGTGSISITWTRVDSNPAVYASVPLVAAVETGNSLMVGHFA